MWRTAIVLTCLACSAVAAPQAPAPSSSAVASASRSSTAASGSRTSQASGTPSGNALPPFYSAPNTFEPTATGPEPVPGSVVTIINSNGAGSYTDTFVYTAAASTVPPTGNVTEPVTGAAATVSNLQPDPQNLQTAAANPRALNVLPVAIGTTVVGLVLASIVGGAALV